MCDMDFALGLDFHLLGGCVRSIGIQTFITEVWELGWLLRRYLMIPFSERSPGRWDGWWMKLIDSVIRSVRVEKFIHY